MKTETMSKTKLLKTEIETYSGELADLLPLVGVRISTKDGPKCTMNWEKRAKIFNGIVFKKLSINHIINENDGTDWEELSNKLEEIITNKIPELGKYFGNSVQEK